MLDNIYLRAAIEYCTRLILATKAADDPVALLKAAARDHIPVNPSEPVSWPKVAIPEPANRPSISEVIAEIMQQEWYSDQIVKRRTVDAKAGQIGSYPGRPTLTRPAFIFCRRDPEFCTVRYHTTGPPKLQKHFLPLHSSDTGYRCHKFKQKRNRQYQDLVGQEYYISS